MEQLISSPTLKLLALSMLKGVGPATLKKVASIAGFDGMAIEELEGTVAQVARALEAEPTSAWSLAQDAASKQVEAAEKHRARILSPLDPDYPRLLAETKDDPFLLYVKGSLARDPTKSVAIIGTREPTPTGEIIAQRVARTFAEQGWSIVSGLALGCDAIAHQAALDAAGHTVAVLAHGLHMIAPSRHKGLAQAILDAGGALVSEYPFGQAVQSQQFVKRDRTQAGMAQGVVMIQSDIKGGSLHASRAALDYDRWLAVPYPTPKDLQHGEPKVQGNLVIADGTVQEKATLLRCSTRALDRILILRERVDILRLAGADIDASVEGVESAQSELTTANEEAAQSALSTQDLLESTPAGVEPVELAAALGDELEPVDVVEPLPSPAESVAPIVAATERVGERLPQLSAEPTEVRTEPHAELASPPHAPSKRSPRYHVAVLSVHSAHDLTIARVPPRKIIEFRSNAGVTAHDIDLVVVLASRLDHLQERLNEVKRFRVSMDDAFDEGRSAHLQFFVEEVLVHMKRSVDDLTRLKFAKHAPATVELPALVQSTQMSLIEAKEIHRELHVDLVATLDQIVKSLPLSAEVTSSPQKSNPDAQRDGVVDINLDDLVHSFNGFVTMALDSEVTSHATQSS
jgi:DNA protecting protein DprA